jgi:DNA-directed RNA polymerase subunit omega
MARITVEDCLTKETNRFALVSLASKRTKQLLGGAKCLVDSKGNKSVVASLREIAFGAVRFMTEAEVQSEIARDLEEKRRVEEARRAQELAATQHVEVRDSAGTLLNPLPSQAPAIEATSEASLLASPLFQDKSEDEPRPVFKDSPIPSDF